MTMDVHEIIMLLAYASLALELVVFPIPSEASTYQLFLREAPRAPEEDRLSRARQRRKRWKLLRYFLPTAGGVVLFLIPLALIPYPEGRAFLLPVPALENDFVLVLGLLAVVLGRSVTLAATLQLRRAQRAEAGLAARGLFKHSRNPGLVGMYVFYLGVAWIYPCWILLLGFFPYAFNMHRRVLMEESHLGHALGEDYSAYREAVPRYLPLGPLR